MEITAAPDLIAFALLAACSESPAGEHYHTGPPFNVISHLVILRGGTYRERIIWPDPLATKTTVDYGHWYVVGPTGLRLVFDSEQHYDPRGAYKESFNGSHDTTFPDLKFERLLNSSDLQSIATDTTSPVRWVKMKDLPLVPGF